jgi:hypothetical protein
MEKYTKPKYLRALLLCGFSASLMAATFLLFEAIVQFFPSVVPEKHRYLAHRLYVRNAMDAINSLNSDRLRANQEAFEFDSLLGWRGIPNVEGVNWSVDGEFYFKTNSEGFRDLDHTLTRPEGRVRIAVVGDSFIWGHNLHQNYLMPQTLERALRAKGYDVEVFNFGIGGFGNDQELLMLDRFVLPYKPDIVALSFFYSNDFWNNYEEVSSEKAKPYFRFAADGSLELRPLRSSTTRQEKKPAAGMNLLRRVRDQLEQRSFIYNLMIRNSLVRSVAGIFGLTSPGSPDEEVARLAGLQKRITREILLMIKEHVERAGAKFFVFIYPGYGYYYGDRAKYYDTIEFFKTDLPLVEVLDLTPEFDKQQEPLYFTLSEHWNERGATLAAEIVAAHIELRYLRVTAGQLHAEKVE